MYEPDILYLERREKQFRILTGVALGMFIAFAVIILLLQKYFKQEEVSATLNIPISVLLAQSMEKNADTVGWIRIEGTMVDYPVMQTDDINYYLSHNAEKNDSEHGAIYLDSNCDPVSLSGSNILYGHHMKDGSMFACLVNYKDKEFFKEHPIIEFDTLGKTYQWEIFSVFITAPSYNYLKTEFSDWSQYLNFIKAIQEKSLFETDVLLIDIDDILILSTCTYEYDDARFVVAARKKINTAS